MSLLKKPLIENHLNDFSKPEIEIKKNRDKSETHVGSARFVPQLLVLYIIMPRDPVVAA